MILRMRAVSRAVNNGGLPAGYGVNCSRRPIDAPQIVLPELVTARRALTMTLFDQAPGSERWKIDVDVAFNLVPLLQGGI